MLSNKYAFFAFYLSESIKLSLLYSQFYPFSESLKGMGLQDLNCSVTGSKTKWYVLSFRMSLPSVRFSHVVFLDVNYTKYVEDWKDKHLQTRNTLRPSKRLRISSVT